MPKTGLTQTQLKERAIACTVDRMRKFGYDKVRLSDIARDLGITHAALYGHFADKSALFDAVSEKWLFDVDQELSKFVEQDGDPLKRIQGWFLHLHRAKCQKVRLDPELYKAFNLSAQIDKQFVKLHLENMHRQLTTLVKEAIARKQISGNASEIVDTLLHATSAFHHPALVVAYINEDREPQLKKILTVMFKGLAKKS